MGVPRVWEKFYDGVRNKLSQVQGVKKALAEWARGVAKQRITLLNEGKQPNAFLRAQYALASRLVLTKLRTALGMANARVCVVGAAPIAREVLEFMATLDINLHEVYGQSEGSGPTSFNVPGATRFGTVGRALPKVEVKLDTDGEILVRGRNVFLGYFKDPAATAETLTSDGWLRSGDLGQFDDQNFLHITGRKKEILITSGGKNITPKNIEMAMLANPLLAEAVVIGDGRKFLTALLTLRPDALEQFLSSRGQWPTDEPHLHPDVRANIQQTIDQVNETLARVETIKKFTVLRKNFSLEAGELTPTLKIKRKVVVRTYANEIEAMYQD